eukprot:SM000191S05210  [mRNA]  locus=s191:77542:80806:- [translate_table: standard]
MAARPRAGERDGDGTAESRCFPSRGIVDLAPPLGRAQRMLGRLREGIRAPNAAAAPEPAHGGEWPALLRCVLLAALVTVLAAAVQWLQRRLGRAAVAARKVHPFAFPDDDDGAVVALPPAKAKARADAGAQPAEGVGKPQPLPVSQDQDLDGAPPPSRRGGKASRRVARKPDGGRVTFGGPASGAGRAPQPVFGHPSQELVELADATAGPRSTNDKGSLMPRLSATSEIESIGGSADDDGTEDADLESFLSSLNAGGMLAELRQQSLARFRQLQQQQRSTTGDAAEVEAPSSSCTSNASEDGCIAANGDGGHGTLELTGGLADGLDLVATPALAEQAEPEDSSDVGTSFDQEPLVEAMAGQARSGGLLEAGSMPEAAAASEAVDYTHSEARGHAETSGEEGAVTTADLQAFLARLDGLDGGESASLTEKRAVEKATAEVAYWACYNDGPGSQATEYVSQTVIEGCSAELMRNFFLDDNFRYAWDDARTESNIIEDWDAGAYQVVHWVRKFPFFLKSREYVIGRRLWLAEDGTAYCVSKHTEHPSRPRRSTPYRVDSFFWRIRTIISRDGDESKPACEITNVHQEDSGIARSVARSGAVLGMWRHVLKLHQGVIKYAASKRPSPIPPDVLKAAHVPILSSSSPVGPQNSEQIGPLTG